MFSLFGTICNTQSNNRDNVNINVVAPAKEGSYSPVHANMTLKEGQPLPLNVAMPARREVAAAAAPAPVALPVRRAPEPAHPAEESPKVLIATPRARRDVMCDMTIGELKMNNEIPNQINQTTQTALQREVQREILHHQHFTAERRRNRGEEVLPEAAVAGGWDDANYSGPQDDQVFTTIHGRKGNFEHRF